MRLGIDLGTTRTVVAVSDRGNFPVLGFTTPEGDTCDFVPTITAEVDGVLVHGFEAEEAARQGAPYARSWKRWLNHGGPGARVCIGARELSALELTTSFLEALGELILHRSNVPEHEDSLPETVVSVPANAHSGQRFTTLEAFRRAGFPVTAMINEPSAAAIEYAHRYRNKLNSKRDHVVVYDLGGGTFDAALVSVAGAEHEVIDTAGIQQLGGDDFDALLLEMALDQAQLPRDVTGPVLSELLDECRAAKEGIGPNTRRIVLELAGLGERAPASPVVLDIAAYYERLRPYVEATLGALGEVMVGGDEHELVDQAAATGVAGVYVVGGGSGLPVVPRILRERFKHRVQRSVYPSASTAIGLAIAASDSAVRPQLKERFARHMGVFREGDSGAQVVFDRIFERGTPMPSTGEPPLVYVRTYRAAHNVGHFRFVECGSVTPDLQPKGDISPHATVVFPFAPQARTGKDLAGVAIERLPGEGPLIEERYEVDDAGVIAVTIRDLGDGFTRRYQLG